MRKIRKKILIGLILGGTLVGASVLAQQIPRFRIKEEAARDNFKKGLAFHNSRQYVAAREFFYKALDINPSFHLARRYLGDSYYYSGEWNAALEQWEFLNSLSADAYPQVRQRSEMLRFNLNDYKRPGGYTYLTAYTPSTWRGYRFMRPVDTAMDQENNLYILSYESANVMGVNPGGSPNLWFTGPVYNKLDGPLAMAIHKDKIYVCDYNADQIRIFSLAGANMGSFGETGGREGQFRGPSGIIVTDEAIYVSDTGNRRVQKFDLSGKFLISFGPDDKGKRPLSPAALTLDNNRILYLADNEGERILTYDRDGNFLGDIRSKYLKKPRGLSINGSQLILADEETGVAFYNLHEKKWTPLSGLRNERDRPIHFNRPFSARIDKNGILYVAEYGAHRVVTIVPRGLRISNLDIKVQRVDASQFPHVAVFLSVKNRLGKPVIGLTRQEINLYENDTRIGGINTENVKVFNKRTNIAIAKENSDFFQQNYNSFLPLISQGLLSPLRVTDRLKVVRIGEQVRLVYEGLQRRMILKTLADGDRLESPNLGKGIYESITRLLGEIGPRYVTLLTSGKSFPRAYNQYTGQRLIQFARANEVRINIISFEGETDPEQKKQMEVFYRDMAVQTGGRYYRAFDETTLKDIYKDMRQTKDRRYIITYKGNEDPKLSGRYVDLRLEVDYLRTQGKGDGGYFVP